MHVTARGDYALRAAIELARADGRTRTVTELAAAQDLPQRFLEDILLALRHASLLQSRRGSDGGFTLARPAESITMADVLCAVEGSLVTIRGIPPEELAYDGSARKLRDAWIAMDASLRAVLERVTLAELAGDALSAAQGRAYDGHPDALTTGELPPRLVPRVPSGLEPPPGIPPDKALNLGTRA